MDLNAITAIIITFNEAPNIGRTLGNLRWMHDILVLDSGSSDETLAIARGFENVRIQSRTFDDFAAQRNFALDQVTTDWVLSLDADYQAGADLFAELVALDPKEEVIAYDAAFRYLVFGKPLWRSILPPRPVLFKKKCCHYVVDGHGERLEISGRSGQLKSRIDHDDRKCLSRWLAAQDNYARLEAAKLKNTGSDELGLADRIRELKWIAPWLVPLICLAQCGVFLDGWRGFYYALQRGLAESLLALWLIDGERSEKAGEDE